MSFLMHNESTAIGASRPIKSNHRIQDHTVEIVCVGTSGTITACTVSIQGGNDGLDTCVSTTALVGASAERVTNSAFYYQVDGTNYTIAAIPNGTILTTSYGTAMVQTITASKYGGLVFVAGTAQTVRCITPNGTAVGVQAYDTFAEAKAALDALAIPAGWCKIGTVVVADGGAGTTFGTTSLAVIGTFYPEYSPFYSLETHAFTTAEVSAQRALFAISGQHADYIRTFISSLSGTGKVTVKYTPAMR